MRLAGFLIVLHVTPHLTTEDSPLKLSHGTSYQTMPHSSQPQSIRRIAIQAGTGFGFISDITYLAFLCTPREYLLKAKSCAKGSPLCYQGHHTWLLGSPDRQRTSWNGCVNQTTRHLSFSSSEASPQSTGLLLHSQPDSPSLAKPLPKGVIFLSCPDLTTPKRKERGPQRS